ncbi:class I adenylate-forming enzyme family protein [Aliiroseovarius sp. PrR006]|uniref:class I adenylate-forming enzyme family protein n=1 Tax=Aliiroseovarius sp. PrR006 TaxID=2706883 RepID=UPI0013D6E340|nr:class I adenylate-forming enzyme family protein [Aliiroseovarius sp. PrR006]NDW52289.1 acyl--CoA ligase [Aliiroseovarius sp. PrR006]
MISELMPSSPLAPAPSPFNMAEYVLQHAERLGDKSALEIVSADAAPNATWTYAQLERAVRGVATGLLDQGLQPGDRVLLRLGNTVDFPLGFLGAIAAGLVPIPSSSQLTCAEITRMADLVVPSLIIADPGIALPDPAPCNVIDTETLHGFTDLPPAAFHQGNPERPAYIIFTSGTSGQARAVLHAHRAIWARQMMWDGWYGITEDDRMMHAGAFNWTYTLGTGLMDPWSVGATALIPAAGSTPDDLSALLHSESVSIFAAAPGVYRQMLKHDLPPLPNLRHGLSAGEKLPDFTRARWVDQTSTPIHEAFGMSECSTFISGSPSRPSPNGALGFGQAGRHLAVLDADGAPVPLGAAGTLAIHRSDPGLMLEYLNAPDATAAKFQGDWFLTGDSASMSETGAFTYEGRSDDIMNAGGYRVSPIEVEAVMAQHPGISEAACVEVSVKADASVIGCFYIPSDAPVSDDELSQHAHALLAHYKCPRLFQPIDCLPRSTNNKLSRAALRLLVDAHGKEIT